jgi:hypothetical protein
VATDAETESGMSTEFVHALRLLVGYIAQQRAIHPEEDMYGLACAVEIVQNELETRGEPLGDGNHSPTAIGEGS